MATSDGLTDVRENAVSQQHENLRVLEQTLLALQTTREQMYGAVPHSEWAALVQQEAEILAQHSYVWVPGSQTTVAPATDPEVRVFWSILDEPRLAGLIWGGLALLAALVVAILTLGSG